MEIVLIDDLLRASQNEDDLCTSVNLFILLCHIPADGFYVEVCLNDPSTCPSFSPFFFLY